MPLGNDELTFAFIRNAFHSLKQTFVPENVRNAFQMLGFEFNVAKSPYIVLFQEERLRGSHGFREIWDADSPLDELSKRCRDVRGGLIRASTFVIRFIIHFTFGLGATSVVKLQSSILHSLQKVLSFGKSVLQFES
jgi:hypothetical protein